MNKSTLKEVIQNVVAHKLAETNGDASKYGYIISGKDTNDPHLQLIGYGNMPKSYWQKKLDGYADELKKRIKAEDWNAAVYFMKQSSVFNLAVNMMNEIYEKDLNELDTTLDSSAAETGLTDADKKELANLKAQSDKLTANIKKIEGDVAKLQQTIQPKMQRAERMKAKLQKQQSDNIRKQQAIQDRA
jgi:chromosome segregation ATPase